MQEDYKPYIHNRIYVNVGGRLIERQVVCAANRYGDLIVLGVRHHCPIMNRTLDLLGIGGFTKEQGFVDQWGNYMDRKEALEVLKANGRFIRDDDFSNELYSENLY